MGFENGAMVMNRDTIRESEGRRTCGLAVIFETLGKSKIISK